MLLKEFRNHFNNELSAVFPLTEIDSFFFLLIEKELGLQRIDLALGNQISISEDKFKHLYNVLSRLKNQEPIQYILGETEFYGLPFKVTKNTLIPRPETEELVAWILKDVKKLESWKAKKPLSILDIGTGTGCIAITLAKNLPNATISAIDISSEAIKIATQNAELNNVQIHFIELDILNTNSLNVIANGMKQSLNNLEVTSPQTSRNDIKFDIIVSNPPYVRELEKKKSNQMY